MFKATSIHKVHYDGFYNDGYLKYTSDTICATKHLCGKEQHYMENFTFTVVNDCECTCTHKIENDTDCKCARDGFSVYICNKKGANVIRNFTLVTK